MMITRREFVSALGAVAYVGHRFSAAAAASQDDIAGLYDRAIVVRGMRQRNHPAAVIEKVIGGNFHRVFKEIWTL